MTQDERKTLDELHQQLENGYKSIQEAGKLLSILPYELTDTVDKADLYEILDLISNCSYKLDQKYEVDFGTM